MIFGLSGSYSLLIFLWTGTLSVISLILMGIDKASAKLRRTRISEKTFGVLSLLGGFLGVILGGIIFHHKTSKPRFWVPVVVAVLLWSGLIYLLLHLDLIRP